MWSLQHYKAVGVAQLQTVAYQNGERQISNSTGMIAGATVSRTVVMGGCSETNLNQYMAKRRGSGCQKKQLWPQTVSDIQRKNTVR